MIYSDSENEMDDRPPLLPSTISVNSCNYLSMCLEFSQDIHELIKGIDNFYFKDKCTRKKYIDDLHAVIKRCRDIYDVLQAYAQNPGERLFY
ncbi:hypothetical protein TNCV_4008571 [Trichonephila clavipes]|nr:hypothetical protein TNCV_4008571 [Trichonephila clavipes]